MNAGMIKKYMGVAFMVALSSYAIIFGLVLSHELAHGGAAIALGGFFPFLRAGIGGGTAIYIFPFGSPNWKEALVLAAGPFLTLLMAPLMLGLILIGIRNRLLKLVAIIAGAFSSAGFIVAGGLFDQAGDVVRALSLVGVPGLYRFLLGLIWLLLGVALLASFFRLFFKELAQFFPAATYSSRLYLVLSSLTLPAFILIGAQALISTRSANGGQGSVDHLLFYAGGGALLSFILPFAIRFGTVEPPSDRLMISPRQMVGLLLVVALAASTQAATFRRAGNSERGMVLTSAPPEVNVSACNIIVNLDEDLRGRVVLLLRPYEDQHKFLWEKIKYGEPADWTYYDRFVQQNLALMLSGDVKIVSHRADPEIPFFVVGTWDRGARVVEAEVDLSDMLYFEARKSRVLKLVDFWRSKGAGYIDFAELNLEGHLQINEFKSQPANSAPPTLSSRTQLRWENSSFDKSFAVTYVAIN